MLLAQATAHCIVIAFEISNLLNLNDCNKRFPGVRASNIKLLSFVNTDWNLLSFTLGTMAHYSSIRNSLKTFFVWMFDSLPQMT